MTINERDFIHDSNYNKKSSFTRIKYGINKALLETELNEMQLIQEEARSSLIRQMVPTGFSEIIRRDFSGPSIVYNPNGLDNSIAIAPSKIIVNGYEVNFEGNDIVNGIEGYTIINFGEAPYSSINYYDFAFIEFWFQELTAESNITKYGNKNGKIISNNIVDSRVNDETSRRVALMYKVRVQNGVNIDKWKDGFGYKNINEYSNIYASGPKDSPIENSDYLFINASNVIFKDENFYKDIGLYVAGRSGNNSIKEDFGILSDFIFAIPLVAVKRRNQSGFSDNNPDGAPRYINSMIASNRPDGLFNNKIVERDVLDLRKSISLQELNKECLIDSSLKKLLTGELLTKSKEKIEKIKFGIQPIDVGSRTDVILNVKFDGSINPLIGPSPTSSGTLKYDLCSNGYGLIIDGSTVVNYKPTPIVNWINKNKGVIEFFIKPYWDGSDVNVSQTIFSILDNSGNIIMEFSKDRNSFVLLQKENASQSSNINKTVALLNNTNFNNSSIYHLRITWDRTYSKTSIFINGKEAGFGSYLLSALTPATLKIGAIENVENYLSGKTGFVIDELIVYNQILPDIFPQLTSDIVNGTTKIYNSFNGVLNGFKDNFHSQRNTIYVLTPNSGQNKLTLNIHGNNLLGSNSVVYNEATGDIINGSWSNINTSNPVFTRSSGNFQGESVVVQCTLELEGGYGVDNIPSRVLKAEMNGKEVAFCKNSDDYRQVQLVNEDGTYEFVHSAIESNSNRNGENAYSRLINYVIESNGTNIYTIPKTLYGFDVAGIKYINKKVKSIKKETTGEITIELVDAIPYNETFNVELAMEGYTFEYNTHSKSIVSNMMKMTSVKITAPGNKNTLKIPAILPDKNGGVIVSFLKTYHKENNIDTEYSYVVYVDGIQTQVSSISGIGTPFISVSFNSNPQINKVIEIPVLVYYQPLTSDNLSVWYEYVPYQGILGSEEKKLERISDWKIFITTLSSGNIVVDNIKTNSINNAVNRLPGGKRLAYTLTGDNFSDEVYPDINKKPNEKLIFTKEYRDIIRGQNYDDFTILNNKIVIQKINGEHQDSKITTNYNLGFYTISTTKAIPKYAGACCLVVDESGNIMLFVVGHLNPQSSVKTIIEGQYGDLFKLDNSPIQNIKK